MAENSSRLRDHNLVSVKPTSDGTLKTRYSREKRFSPPATSFRKKRGMAAPDLSRHSLWRRRIVAAEPLEKTDDHFVIIDQLPIPGTAQKNTVFSKKTLAQFKNRVILYTIPFFGAVAQLARASHWQCEGREFESLLLHQYFPVAKDLPIKSMAIFFL